MPKRNADFGGKWMPRTMHSPAANSWETPSSEMALTVRETEFSGGIKIYARPRIKSHRYLSMALRSQ